MPELTMVGVPLPPTPLARHSRVWLCYPLAPSDVRTVNESYRSEIDFHAALDHPFVARRPQPCDPMDAVPLGLRLRRTCPVRSLSFSVAASAIRMVADAMPLREALECEGLPPTWHTPLQQLEQAMDDIGATLRVYGSLAWQAATGTSYLAENSDVDLLLQPASAQQARACLDLLSGAEQSRAIRLDGEMEFPDGRAVAWKELTTDSAQLLVKTATGVTLDTRESIWQQTSWQ